MTLDEIQTKICDLRCSIEELAEECFNLWKETGDINTEQLADYLHYELTGIGVQLADLEETEEETEDAPQEELDMLTDWWGDLDNLTKSEICNIPFPTFDDGGRGENEDDFKERTDKWWNAQTIQRKREIYDEQTDWWDKE